MGWSGYTLRPNIHFRVDAHGGEKEKRGEELFDECSQRIDAAIKAVVNDPKYAEINPDYYEG